MNLLNTLIQKELLPNITQQNFNIWCIITIASNNELLSEYEIEQTLYNIAKRYNLSFVGNYFVNKVDNVH